MTALAITSGYPFFTDKLGQPLEGKVYFGVAGQNPETSPIIVYWDVALTQPVAQPVNVTSGYIMRAGTPAGVFCATDYSRTVKNLKGEIVSYSTSSTNYDNYYTLVGALSILGNYSDTSDMSKGIALIGGGTRTIPTIVVLKTLPKTGVQCAIVLGYYNMNDGGGGIYYYDSSDTTSTDNGGSVIVASDGGRWKLKSQGIVDIAQFGAKGDYNPSTGTGTDDTTALLNACTYINSTFGAGSVTFNGKHLIDNNITIPRNITIKGKMSLVGTPGVAIPANYLLMPCIAINSTKTITLSSNSGFDGCLIYRKGVVFPSQNSSTFAGTAIVAAGDDTFVINSQIMGFNMAYSSNNYERVKIMNVNFDNINNVYIASCYDISRVENLHSWPFISVAYPTSPDFKRGGAAYKFENVGDWNKVTNCFCYGYLRGYQILSCNSMTLISCGADSPGSYTGQIGFEISGTSEDTRLTNCQAAAQETSYYINTSSGNHTRFFGCDSWNATTHGILHASGDFSVIGGVIRISPNGISSTTGSARVWVDKVRFTSITTPFNLTTTNADFNVGVDNDYPNLTFGTPVIGSVKTIKNVASASTIAIPPEVKMILVSGITNINNITGGWAGRELLIKFTGVLVVNDGAGNINLAGNLSAGPNTTLRLVYDGTAWLEISRSIN